MRYRIFLFITALVWGCAFVAQRIGAEFMGPFAFNGLRFWFGALTLLPLTFLSGSEKPTLPKKERPPVSLKGAICILGFFLFTGAALQQFGIAYTTAGKSGFISALYIVCVPVAGIYFGNALRLTHLIGCAVAMAGTYFLSVYGGGLEDINLGDAVTLAGVFFWTFHIISISIFVRYYDGLRLAVGQFIVCGFFNFIAMFIVGEPLTVDIIRTVAWPLAYCAVFSTGVGFTLQILGQKGLSPTEASLIGSVEMIFSLMAGYVYLGEQLTTAELFGAVLMTFGIVTAQLPSRVICERNRAHKPS